MLFNDTIMYNIKYAKPHATDEEVSGWLAGWLAGRLVKLGGWAGGRLIAGYIVVPCWERALCRWMPGCPCGSAESCGQWNSTCWPVPPASSCGACFLHPPACLQVVEAAQAACIHDTIVNRFPLKYDTVVGERGLRLRWGAEPAAGCLPLAAAACCSLP